MSEEISTWLDRHPRLAWAWLLVKVIIVILLLLSDPGGVKLVYQGF